MFIIAKIASIFISLSAVHIYDLHMFTVIIFSLFSWITLKTKQGMRFSTGLTDNLAVSCKKWQILTLSRKNVNRKTKLWWQQWKDIKR